MSVDISFVVLTPPPPPSSLSVHNQAIKSKLLMNVVSEKFSKELVKAS